MSHVYGAGRFTATVAATNAAGEAAQAQVTVSVTRRTVTLEAPRRLAHGEAGVFAGTLRPPVAGARVQIYRGKTFVTSARVRANGRFRATVLLRSPGPYHARYGSLRSAKRSDPLAPADRRRARLDGAGRRRAHAPPEARPGRRRHARRPGLPRRRGSSGPGPAGCRRRAPARSGSSSGAAARAGYAVVRRVLRAQVVVPSLSLGARGPSVLALERRLAELHYALRGVDGDLRLRTPTRRSSPSRR